jgi:hypothetical protein
MSEAYVVSPAVIYLEEFTSLPCRYIASRYLLRSMTDKINRFDSYLLLDQGRGRGVRLAAQVTCTFSPNENRALCSILRLEQFIQVLPVVPSLTAA